MSDVKTETPGDRLRKARIKAGYRSAASFAAAHDITESTYRSAENAARGLSLSAAKKYAALLGVTWQWLIDGGLMPELQKRLTKPHVESPVSDINVPGMPRDLPILGSGAAGEDGLFELNGQTIDYGRRPPRLIGVRDAYAIYLNGSCMSPWRENGQIVYVHPHLAPQPGDYVVVQLRQEVEGGPFPAYIKRLVRRTATEVRLLQFNPHEEKSIPMRRVHIIHRIMDWPELLGL